MTPKSLPCLLVGLLLLSGCSAGQSDWARRIPSSPAPDLTLPKLDGGEVTLSDYHGQVVIMEFWATWCGPCRMSTPSLEAIYRRYRDKGVTVLLVNAGETPDVIRVWAKRRFTAPILLDQDGAAAELFGIDGIPRLFIIDQAGDIAYERAGYEGGLEQNLHAILKEMLAASRS